MRKKAVAGIIIFGALLVSTGCVAPETGSLSPSTTVCPDASLVVDRMYFSTTPYRFGEAENAATVFQPTDPVHSTMWLSTDVCCTRVILICEHEGEIVFRWEDAEGFNVTKPQPVEITAPPEGFAPGEYTVRVFIDIREVINLGFTVAPGS